MRRLTVTTLTVAVLVSGCVSPDDWSRPHETPRPVGTLGPGFVDPAAPPTPEATITPRPGSWSGVHPAPGYRVVLLIAGDDPRTKILSDAVTEWAGQEQVSRKTLTATRPDEFVPTISQAIALKPDLVISVGNEIIDALTLVTANHLDQQFLVIGAELAEPTANVTAANWPGASFRGEGLTTSTGYDPTTFTPERAASAVRAGAAAVLTSNTGIVLRLN